MPQQPLPPVAELVNTLEMEAIARRKLDSFTFGSVSDAGAPDRAAFDRITFRPRLMVNTAGLDLTTELFGLRMFAPILAGPASQQQRFHPESELASARGAAAAKAAVVISEQSSQPLAKVAAECAAGFWYQGSQRARIEEAVQSGCKAVCVAGGADWAALDVLRKGLTVPFLLKGVMNPAEARAAVERGWQGIVVSNYRGPGATGLVSSIEVLPTIVEAVSGRVPVLIDGGFRRGSDILKAIALGAKAVLVTRPVLWGLAAYGAPGVQHVLELLQTELARDMAMCGRAKITAVDKTLVRLHTR
jgi:isopentenyl diphosphate isomerase/L-lactate dehydrogenase-like FMN-dependent dehydrogenase